MKDTSFPFPLLLGPAVCCCYAGRNNGYIEVDNTSKTREKSVDENIDQFGQKGQQISITLVSNEKACLFPQ